MNNKIQAIKYIFTDYTAALLSWSLFFIYRKIYVESYIFESGIPVELDSKFYMGLLVIPLFWLFLYYASGHYRNIYKKSRLNEFGQTFLTTLIGVLVIFFLLILDDTIASYKNYYSSFLVLFTIHFFFTYVPRLIITTRTIRRIQDGRIGFNTILIGGNGKARETYQEIMNQPVSTGNHIIGFVSVKNKVDLSLKKTLPYLGEIDQIQDIVKKYDVEEIIISIEYNEHDKVEEIISQLGYMNVTLKALPDLYDLLTGKVKITSIFGAPFIQISDEPMPQWQYSIKQFLDISISLLALLITLPISIFIMVAIKFTSNGPLIYKHERIGKYGKPFNIYKFRTMYTDAEINGPQLSRKFDRRITPIGRFLRKTRLDEIPNFVNVLKGDMSLVGPRPERKFYIDQIVKIAPHYHQLQKVKPGITSLGQVKFGYAENVEEMIQRLRYDIIYINNMSLFIDFQIMIYTVVTILKGEGK